MSPEPLSVTPSYGGVRIKEEQREEPTDGLEEHLVQVKEERDWLEDFQREVTDTANGDVKQEIDLNLYAGHKVEPGLVLGPEGPQPPDSTFTRPLIAVCRDPRTGTVGSRVTVHEPHRQMPTKSTKCSAKPTLKREKLYSCDMCIKKYTTKYALNTHRKTHTDPGKTCYYCDLCVRHFTTQRNLNLHIQSHTGVKQFSCKVCMKYFSYECSLKAHIKTHTHTIKKNYSCDICMKFFTTSNSLKKHRHTHVSHTEVKALYCDMCMKMFTKKNSLIIHLQTHCRDKPYTCSICDRQFKLKKYFLLHMQNHEGVVSPLSCEFCMKQFNQKIDLVVHSRTHTGENPYS